MRVRLGFDPRRPGDFLYEFPSWFERQQSVCIVESVSGRGRRFWTTLFEVARRLEFGRRRLSVALARNLRVPGVARAIGQTLRMRSLPDPGFRGALGVVGGLDEHARRPFLDGLYEVDRVGIRVLPLHSFSQPLRDG